MPPFRNIQIVKGKELNTTNVIKSRGRVPKQENFLKKLLLFFNFFKKDFATKN